MAAINTIQLDAWPRIGQGQSTTRAPTRPAAPAPHAGPHEPAAPESDPDAVRELVAHLQEVMRRYADEPHEVGFRPDPTGRGFVIEIRDLDGEIVTQIPPEKVLNLRRRLAELSGMVVDAAT